MNITPINVNLDKGALWELVEIISLSHVIRIYISLSAAYFHLFFLLILIIIILPTIDQQNITITTKSRIMKFIGPGFAKSTTRQITIDTVRGSIQ